MASARSMTLPQASATFIALLVATTMSSSGTRAADAPGAAPRKTGRGASHSTAGAEREQGFEKVQGKSQMRALSRPAEGNPPGAQHRIITHHRDVIYLCQCRRSPYVDRRPVFAAEQRCAAISKCTERVLKVFS